MSLLSDIKRRDLKLILKFFCNHSSLQEAKENFQYWESLSNPQTLPSSNWKIPQWKYSFSLILPVYSITINGFKKRTYNH